VVVQAEKTKVTLSANTQARYGVEGLFEDTDFSFMMQRAELEGLFPDLQERLQRPITTALARANVTMESVGAVEIVGGGSRVPMINVALAAIINGPREKAEVAALDLGRHLNGDEAMAMGSAFVVANLSTHFRVKKMWYTDITEHDYRLRVRPLNPEQFADCPAPEGDETWETWKRDITFKRGTAFPASKPVRIRAPFDLHFVVEENGKPVEEFHVLQYEARKDLLSKNDYNLTSQLPTLSFVFAISTNGVPGVEDIESHMFYQAEQVSYKKVEVATNTSNSTENATGEAEKPADQENPADETGKPADQENPADETEKPADQENPADEPEKPEKVESEGEGEDSANATNASNSSYVDPVYEKVYTYKKKKVKIASKISAVLLTLRPLNGTEAEDAKKRLKVMNLADQYVRDLDGARNELETNIYAVREKCEDENVVAVSTSEEIEKVQALASETQMWLEDYGLDAETTLDMVKDKTTTLAKAVAVLTGRAWEREQREQLAESVEAILKGSADIIEYVKANKTWVSEEQQQMLTNKTDAFVEWWASVTKEQETKAATDDPAYTVREAAAKLQAIKKEGERLMRIQYVPKAPPSPAPGYDDIFKNSNFSKEWYENFKKNFSNFSDSEFNFSGFNFSNMSFNKSESEEAHDAEL
jgi:hypoxia up-regulated 1